MTRPSKEKRFADKVALVTGGTSGIGETIVERLAGDGAHVVFCGLIDREGDALQRRLLEQGLSARYVHADVRCDDDMKMLVEKASQLFNGVHLAVNNAGISHPPQRLADIEPDIWQDVMRTNADGVFYAMRHEIPALISHAGGEGGGSIVNIASILGTRGSPWIAAYGASKHAVIGLTMSAARDYADYGLRINAVSPGPVDTPMLQRALLEIDGDTSKYAGGFPPAGPGSTNDVADAVLYLLSDDAAYINGANLHVDGATSTI